MLELVLGGARSGKSRFAQRLATATGREVVYVGTARAGDAEMADRIARHQADRPDNWRTVESPENLDPEHFRVRDRDTVVIDGLGVWVSNMLGALALLAGAGLPGAETVTPRTAAAIEQPIRQSLATLTGWSRARSGRTIVVSEEVGWGIVPAYPLGRLFRDLLGRCNQDVAAGAEHTYLVIAGLAVDITRLAHELESGQALP